MWKLFLFVFLIPLSSHAEPPSKIEPYTTVCSEEQSSGFSWIGSLWEQVNFRKTKYVIIKLTDRDSLRTSSCQSEQSFKHIFDSDYVIKACYNVRPITTPFSSYSSLMCDEFYSGGSIESIVCKDPITKVTFNPNGNFIASEVHGNIRNSPKKDSIKISVGKCSVAELTK